MTYFRTFLPQIPIYHGSSERLLTALDPRQALLYRKDIALDLVDPGRIDNLDLAGMVDEEEIDEMAQPTEDETGMSDRTEFKLDSRSVFRRQGSVRNILHFNQTGVHIDNIRIQL